jgi:hypothetical protein
MAFSAGHNGDAFINAKHAGPTASADHDHDLKMSLEYQGFESALYPEIMTIAWLHDKALSHGTEVVPRGSLMDHAHSKG